MIGRAHCRDPCGGINKNLFGLNGIISQEKADLFFNLSAFFFIANYVKIDYYITDLRRRKEGLHNERNRTRTRRKYIVGY